jgi:chitinase
VLGNDLRANPELVAQNATIAWGTALWFWMTQEGAGYYTPHDGILSYGFGETIRSINGGQECGGNWGAAGIERVSYYKSYCSVLGVDPGEESGLSC